MHILFISDNFPPEVNAPATRTYEHCREWVHAGHQITVITCAPNFPKGKVYEGFKNWIWQSEVIDGIRVIRVWTFITANEGIVKRSLDYASFMVAAIIAAPFVKKVDLVIGTSPQFFAVCAAWVVSRFKRKPFVFELRDIWPESIKVVGAMKDSAIIKLLEKIEMKLYQSADRIVTVTNSFRDTLVYRKVDPNKIDVVTNGVNLESFGPQPKDQILIHELNLDGKFVAGYIGTHGLAHNLETILEAAKLLNNQSIINNIHFVFLGDGARKNRLIDLAKKNGLNNVTFIDSVAKNEVIKYWSILDVSIIHLKNSSLFKTVIPSKLFEGMGMGTPVLHGVEGESAKIVTDTKCGLLFESENAQDLVQKLLKLQTDRTLYDQLRLGALESASQYDRRKLAIRMLGILSKTQSMHAGISNLKDCIPPKKNNI